MKLKKIISVLFVFGLLLITPVAKAADIQIISNTSTAYQDGSYTLNDAQALVVKFANIILQIVGVLTFAMFIYGGVLFLISAGSADTVKKAKKIIVAAVVGLVIVFVSYTAVQFFIESITGKDAPNLTTTE